MSIVPKPLSVQTVNALRDEAPNYEAHRSSIEKTNQIISAMGSGAQLSIGAVSLSSGMGNGAKITAFSGTAKRGTVSLQIGTSGIGSNPTVTINFPSGTYDVAPFAQVTRNGGTGVLGYTFTETQNQLVITISGTPTASTTYIFRYSVQE